MSGKDIIGRKTQYFFLAVIGVISILFRYPTSSFMIDHANDSHFYTFLANSITYFGRAKWIIHPLSYMGQYPFSSTTGYPMFLSSVSQAAGVPVDIALLVLTYFISLVGIIGMFLLLREMFDNSIFSLTGSFFFALMPITIWYSSWSLTDRIFVVYLTPFFLFFLLRTAKDNSRIFVALSLTTLLFTFLFHKISYFLLPVLLSFLLSGVIMKSKFLVPQYLRKRARWFWATLLLISFEGSILFSAGFGRSYTRGIFTIGPVALTSTMNAFISLVGGANLVILLSVPGIFYLLWIKYRERAHIFLIVTLLTTFPLLQFRIYSRPFVSIFIIIAGAYALYWGRNLLNRKKFAAILISICIVSLVFTSVMLSHWGMTGLHEYSWDSDAENRNGERFDCIVYAGAVSSKNGSFISNSWGDARYFQAYISSPNAPPMHGLDPMSLLIYDYVSPEEIRNEVSVIPLDQPDRYIENEGPFSLSGVDSYYIGEIGRLTKLSVNSMVAQKIMENYDTQFVVTNKALGLHYYDRWYYLTESKFFSSLNSNSYKSYESEKYIIWTA